MIAAPDLGAGRSSPHGLTLQLVTDPDRCAGLGVTETVIRAVAGGASLVQVRDKAAATLALLRTVLAITRAVGRQVPVLVNDRVDVALAARELGAGTVGVHLGQSDLPVTVARALLGPEVIIGLTAHTDDHLRQLRTLPTGTVDYLGVGVIRATGTKTDHPPELGVDGFARFAARSPLPCVAIGGITIDDLAPLRQAGAAGVAVVSALCGAADPTAAADAFVRHWERS